MTFHVKTRNEIKIHYILGCVENQLKHNEFVLFFKLENSRTKEL